MLYTLPSQLRTIQKIVTNSRIYDKSEGVAELVSANYVKLKLFYHLAEFLHDYSLLFDILLYSGS